MCAKPEVCPWVQNFWISQQISFSAMLGLSSSQLSMQCPGDGSISRTVSLSLTVLWNLGIQDFSAFRVKWSRDDPRWQLQKPGHQMQILGPQQLNVKKKKILWETVACWSMAERESEAGACHLEAKDGSRWGEKCCCCFFFFKSLAFANQSPFLDNIPEGPFKIRKLISFP